MVGSRRSSLNHGLSLKAQYEAALHDLTDLVDTAQDKMAADQKMTVASVIEVQLLLNKHKVRRVVDWSRISFTHQTAMLLFFIQRAIIASSVNFVFLMCFVLLQEFFQGLECHMILTQTFYSKVSGLVAQRESQALEETMALAHSVLKQAHRRGVELEGILEVGISSSKCDWQLVLLAIRSSTILLSSIPKCRQNTIHNIIDNNA